MARLDHDPVEVINYCQENGFSRFDTAPNYGKGSSESTLGRSMMTSSFWVQTKAGNSSTGQKSFVFSDIEAELNESARRLGRVPDSVLLHNPRLHSKDLLALSRHFTLSYPDIELGISVPRDFYFDPDLLLTFKTIQVDANLLYESPFEGQCPNLQARSVLASGLLTTHFLSNSGFEEADHRSSWVTGNREYSLRSAVVKVQCLAEEFSLSLEDASLCFMLLQQSFNSYVIGVKRIEHVDSLLKCISMLSNLSDTFFIDKFSALRLELVKSSGW